MPALAHENCTNRDLAGLQPFNRGYPTFHREEIAAGQQLHAGLVLLLGKARARRLLGRDAGAVFERLRYGRRWLSTADGSTQGICVMIDRAPFFYGKARSEHVMLPGRAGWGRFSALVNHMTMRPRWAEGFTAPAEALDDLGYAIAESIAAIMCWGIDSDDDVCHPVLNKPGAK
jgi:hypothetical protein